jgi:hypothetical protein
LRGAEGS